MTLDFDVILQPSLSVYAHKQPREAYQKSCNTLNVVRSAFGAQIYSFFYNWYFSIRTVVMQPQWPSLQWFLINLPIDHCELWTCSFGYDRCWWILPVANEQPYFVRTKSTLYRQLRILPKTVLNKSGEHKINLSDLSKTTSISWDKNYKDFSFTTLNPISWNCSMRYVVRVITTHPIRE